MISRTSDQCLVIGRTELDQQQCVDQGLAALHPPAPTTFIWNDWDNFDGDIICVHTLKYGALCACALERSPRVQAEMIKHPGKVVIMTSHYHRHYHFTPEEQAAGVFFFNGDYTKKVPEGTPFHDYPTTGQSGVATLWLALHLGYKKVYTVGLDFISLQFPQGIQYEQSIAQDFMNHHVKGTTPVNGAASLTLTPGKKRSVIAAEQVIKTFPDQQVFKVHSVSRMPCEVAEPPTKGVQ